MSFVFAAVTCGLAALCYAEFASTLPVAGSAYTFSYATFGEFVAWIIGWDLILEFAVGRGGGGQGLVELSRNGVRILRRHSGSRGRSNWTGARC